MIRFPTNYLILDACDLSGKTTLYNSIHKKSKFSWNIQDRSALSMFIYGLHYKRKTEQLLRNLWEELSCLNNRFVFMSIPWETIEARYKKRGDEHQTLKSLEKLYDLYDDNDWVRFLPNAITIDNSELTIDDTTDAVVGWLKTKESFGIDDISSEVYRFVANTQGRNEATLNFTFYDDGNFEEENEDILEDKEEGEYYEKIMTTFFAKINSELVGMNEDYIPQNFSSRRFVYADASCISFIQVMLREDILDMHVVLRSSNVEKTFNKDLNFIYHLAAEIKRQFPNLMPGEVRFRIEMNSAHII